MNQDKNGYELNNLPDAENRPEPAVRGRIVAAMEEGQDDGREEDS
jgi:hypothetical protein